MLKRLSTTILLILAATQSWAQVGELRKELAIGVNGGYNLNSVNFSPTVKQSRKGGLTGGLTVRYTCEKYFKSYCALQAEVNFTQLGWKEVTDQNADYTYTRTLNYVQVPFLTRLAWGRDKKGVQFFFLVGPQVGFCLGESESRPADWNGFLTSRPNKNLQPLYDMKVDNKFDYGITGGIGLEVNSKIGHFLLEGRYYYGLGDIFGNSKKDLFSRSANGDIIIKASYLFDVIK